MKNKNKPCPIILSYDAVLNDPALLQSLLQAGAKSVGLSIGFSANPLNAYMATSTQWTATPTAPAGNSPVPYSYTYRYAPYAAPPRNTVIVEPQIPAIPPAVYPIGFAYSYPQQMSDVHVQGPVPPLPALSLNISGSVDLNNNSNNNNIPSTSAAGYNGLLMTAPTHSTGAAPSFNLNSSQPTIQRTQQSKLFKPYQQE